VNKNLLNRNLFLFLLITSLSIGGIIVYARNNMTDPNQKIDNAALGNTTQTAQNTNQTDKQTIQNFDINSAVDQTVDQEKVQVSNSNNSAPSATPLPTRAVITEVTELKVRDVVVGNGPEVKSGDKVEVNYTGTFLNGQKFDSSYDRNQTFEFLVGAGQVIRGWDLGLIGMKVGGKRELLIPSDLAYGASGSPGAIPPNTSLRFEIELVSIE
jgi:FKBP-type peptidyl-prolyl cis-trans isomerase